MGRLTKWQWARQRVGHAWLEQIAVGVITAALSYLAEGADELASVGIGTGAAALLAR